MWPRLKWLLTRYRPLYRSFRKLGFWPTVSLARIQFGPPQKVYRLRIQQCRHPIYVRGRSTSDTNVLYEIMVHGEYDLLNDLDAPQSVIDGGANIGMTALYLLTRYPSARIVCVEPFAGSFEICCQNLEPYGTRATAIQGAIWPEEGSLCLDRGRSDTTNRVRSAAAGETGSTKTLTMKSLISLIGGSVDLLKLDVEGSEKEIFGPCAAEWLPGVRNIIIELRGKHCEDRFFGALAPFEYEISHRNSAGGMVCFLRNLRPKRV